MKKETLTVAALLCILNGYTNRTSKPEINKNNLPISEACFEQDTFVQPKEKGQ